MSLEIALSNAILYLAYTMTLALALQTGIENLKPFIITPLREALKISDENYIAFMYIVRAVLTVIAYLLVWGGVAATRLAAPFLAFVPDVALGVVTVLVVIGGESIINDWTDRLRALKEAAEAMQLAHVEFIDAETGEPISPTGYTGVKG